jgi:hypothetical protein
MPTYLFRVVKSTLIRYPNHWVDAPRYARAGQSALFAQVWNAPGGGNVRYWGNEYVLDLPSDELAPIAWCASVLFEAERCLHINTAFHYVAVFEVQPGQGIGNKSATAIFRVANDGPFNPYLSPYPNILQAHTLLKIQPDGSKIPLPAAPAADHFYAFHVHFNREGLRYRRPAYFNCLTLNDVARDSNGTLTLLVSGDLYRVRFPVFRNILALLNDYWSAVYIAEGGIAREGPPAVPGAVCGVASDHALARQRWNLQNWDTASIRPFLMSHLSDIIGALNTSEQHSAQARHLAASPGVYEYAVLLNIQRASWVRRRLQQRVLGVCEPLIRGYEQNARFFIYDGQKRATRVRSARLHTGKDDLLSSIEELKQIEEQVFWESYYRHVVEFTAAQVAQQAATGQPAATWYYATLERIQLINENWTLYQEGAIRCAHLLAMLERQLDFDLRYREIVPRGWADSPPIYSHEQAESIPAQIPATISTDLIPLLRPFLVDDAPFVGDIPTDDDIHAHMSIREEQLSDVHERYSVHQGTGGGMVGASLSLDTIRAAWGALKAKAAAAYEGYSGAVNQLFRFRL